MPNFRHEPANDLPQKLRRLADGNVLVVDLPVQPSDQTFQRPVARTAEREHLLVKRGDEITFQAFLPRRLSAPRPLRRHPQARLCHAAHKGLYFSESEASFALSLQGCSSRNVLSNSNNIPFSRTQSSGTLKSICRS